MVFRAQCRTLRATVSALLPMLILSLSMAIVGSPATVAQSSEPVRLIFDTDIGNDVDDVLALGMIHALVSRGECELLAVTVTKDHELAGPFVDCVNTFYGRGAIPVGVVRNGPTPEQGKFNGLAAQKDGDQFRYSHDLLSGNDAPEATGLLRRILAAQPDHSVVIAQVGFSTNMVRLLDSKPDDYSPLNGRELIAQKVRLFSVMAGAFQPINGQRHLEYNVVKDIPSAKRIATEWPTPILYSGFEIGISLPYPAVSIEQDYRYVAHHPLAEAYVLYSPPPHNRPTWDLTSVLQVVRPNRGYFDLSVRGRVIVEDDGGTRFEPSADGSHQYLIVSPEQIIRTTEALVQLSSQPPTATSRSQP